MYIAYSHIVSNCALCEKYPHILYLISYDVSCHRTNTTWSVKHWKHIESMLVIVHRQDFANVYTPIEMLFLLLLRSFQNNLPMSSITELLYTSTKLSISLNNIRFMLLLFMPKHWIDRHSVHLHARVVILKLPSGVWLMTNYAEGVTAISNRAINEQACNKRCIRNDCIPWWSMAIS